MTKPRKLARVWLWIAWCPGLFLIPISEIVKGFKQRSDSIWFDFKKSTLAASMGMDQQEWSESRRLVWQSLQWSRKERNDAGRRWAKTGVKKEGFLMRGWILVLGMERWTELNKREKGSHLGREEILSAWVIGDRDWSGRSWGFKKRHKERKEGVRGRRKKEGQKKKEKEEEK